jgi:hypothetical protein
MHSTGRRQYLHSGIFTAPYYGDWVMRRRPERDKVGLFEFVCEENNRCPGGTCRANAR